MDWLSDNDLRDSFNARASILDAAIAGARKRLALDTVQVIDRSNRTGASKGAPYFWYCVLLEDRRDDGPISVARVTLDFVEPLARDVGALVEASWLAEEFWPSSGSSLRKVQGGRKWDAAALPSVDELADAVARMMLEARKALGRSNLA